jgi:hypothetical protein
MGSVRIYKRKGFFPFFEKEYLLDIQNLPYTIHSTKNGFEIKGEAYKENLYLEAYGYRILSWMNKQEQKLSLIPNLLSLGRVCLVYRPGTKVIVK